jgi:hypothetical protein
VVSGHALAGELAEPFEGFRFALRDRADGGTIAVGAVTEIIFFQRRPAIADE